LILAMVMLLRGFADAIMILFMAMPFLVGLWNIVIPQQIGARGVAFPFLNAVSFWLTAMGAMLVMVSLGVGDFSQAGWTGYPPFSELAYQPTTGVDYWIWSIQLSGLGTLVTCVLIILSFPVITVALGLLSFTVWLHHTDPIFQGMAVSLLFGVLVSTLLTLMVVPLGCLAAGRAMTACRRGTGDAQRG
jgi:cytochrome o ubiquinol oxidase subunit 1